MNRYLAPLLAATIALAAGATHAKTFRFRGEPIRHEKLGVTIRATEEGDVEVISARHGDRIVLPGGRDWNIRIGKHQRFSATAGPFVVTLRGFPPAVGDDVDLEALLRDPPMLTDGADLELVGVQPVARVGARQLVRRGAATIAAYRMELIGIPDTFSVGLGEDWHAWRPVGEAGRLALYASVPVEKGDGREAPERLVELVLRYEALPLD